MNGIPCNQRAAACPHNSAQRPILMMNPDPRLGRLLSATLPAALLALWPASAFAYIDPNAGGALFQLLAPVFAAAVGGFLFLRRWFTALLRKWWLRLTGRAEE
jgi:hypothetical protein